jgi:hypothetical protein
MRPAGKRGIPKRRFSAIAAPTNSARSVAMAMTSACSQRPKEVRRPRCSRASSGRLRPVAVPHFAERFWMSIAMRFAPRITQSSR